MTQQVRQGVSLLMLGLALAVTSPAVAADTTTHKTETTGKTKADTAKSDKTTVKTAAVSDKKATSTKTSKTADSDSDKPAKASSSKTQLADADDDKPAKTSKTTAKPTSKTADADDSKPAKAAAGKSKSTKLADADDDAPSKGKASTSKSTKVADADDDKPAKNKTSATGKSAKSKTDLADKDDDATSKSSKTSKTAARGRSGKTDLADKDDDDSSSKSGSKSGSKSSKTGKDKTQLASKDCVSKSSKTKSSKTDTKCKAGKTDLAAKDDKPSKSKSAAKGKDSDDQSDSKTTKLAAAKPAPDKKTAAAALQPSPTLTPATEAPKVAPEPAVAMNAAPVPYTRIRTQAQNTNGVLTPWDAQLYQAAFAQVDQGDYDGAEASLAQVQDKSLVGYVEYHKLFSLGYTASYDELIAWLNQYGDQPVAMKVWNLAKRKKPDGAPDPAFPSLMGNPVNTPAALPASLTGGTAVQLSATTSLAATRTVDDYNPGMPAIDNSDSDLTPKSARSAYNNGQFEQAVVLAKKIGDHWVAGLADWRLKRYDQALVEFKFVSTDPSRNAWSQSSGAYWAARCALALNDKDTADTYFKIAASFPFTFYGLLAEQRLGVTPAVALAKKGLPPTFQGGDRDGLTASLDDDFAWAKGNTQARRMSALVQIGRPADAKEEVQSAMQHAGDATERDHWLALAAYNQVPVSQLRPTDRLFDVSLYPIPNYHLNDSYGVDKALVFAFARKESKFNANAKSYSGAYGLLQLMPSTAALVENDPTYNKKPSKLLKPATNLRVGQKYIARLMDSSIVGGDLLRTIAAYNAGPRPVKDAMDNLGNDYDSLLVMESIPVAQTRQYVEEVAANYWIYRQIMGKDSPSLVQAASDARIV
ncbi:MAG TPA: transglycosylase SLT domain-containing protein, partial [Asticcacaulis sp.]|nr:transglycosylase SLT domain-containing protein [Asticcacaulis sp.]